MYQTEGVSNVQGFAKTAYIAIKQQENVMMDVVCIGQGYIVMVHGFQNLIKKLNISGIDDKQAKCQNVSIFN